MLIIQILYCQLLFLLFAIHSLNMLSHQIPLLLSITIWKLTFSDSLNLPKFPCHLIIVAELYIISRPNSSTRCATELNSFRGYWHYRSIIIIIIIVILQTYYLGYRYTVPWMTPTSKGTLLNIHYYYYYKWLPSPVLVVYIVVTTARQMACLINGVHSW